MEFIYDYTDDGLKLPAVHWNADKKDICVVCIHGMCGNILENYFAHVWGRELQKKDIGFIYGHTRGYCHINDIITKDNEVKRIGTTFEIFDECIFDIDLWTNKAKELGYKRIILLGHSLGCNKVIYYLYNKILHSNNIVSGLILASAPDLIGKLKMSIDNYAELINEAKENVKNGEPRKVLKESIDNWYNLSSATFLSLYDKDSNCNNIPIKDKEEIFKQLSIIDMPILTFSGEKEHAIYHELDFIKAKCIKCPTYESFIIKNCGHTYKNCEIETADVINKWIKNNYK